MRDLGQFLAGPGAFLNTPALGMVWGLVALCVTLACAVRFVLRPLFPEARWRNAVFSIPLLALGGTAAVLLLQWGARSLYAEGHFQGFSRGDQFDFLLVWTLQGIGGIIGWGYSESVAPRPFGSHILSFMAGVALPEEMVKGLVGLGAIGLLFLATNSSRESLNKCNRARFLACIGMAFLVGGLSYGAGEAIFYFQVYAGTGVPTWIYLMRAVWCVCLHGAWASLTGIVAMAAVDFVGFVGPWAEKVFGWLHAFEGPYGGVLFLTLIIIGYILCCAPAVILHGLYDAACIHDDATACIVGGISFVVCLLLLACLTRLGRRAGRTAGAAN